MKDKLIINKKPLKGEDGHRTFSVRLQEETINRLDMLSAQSNHSRNEIIRILLEYALENCEVL